MSCERMSRNRRRRKGRMYRSVTHIENALLTVRVHSSRHCILPPDASAEWSAWSDHQRSFPLNQQQRERDPTDVLCEIPQVPQENKQHRQDPARLILEPPEEQLYESRLMRISTWSRSVSQLLHPLSSIYGSRFVVSRCVERLDARAVPDCYAVP